MSQCDCFAVGPYACLEHGKRNRADRDEREYRERLAAIDPALATAPRPTYTDHWQFGLIFRLESLWVGIHWSKTNRRLCVNLIPCLTFYVTLAGGDTPKIADYPHRWAIRK